MHATWLGAVFSVLLISAATLHLVHNLRLGTLTSIVLLFIVLSTQMLYATVCHIGNDWLAVPLASALFAASVAFHKQTSLKNTLALAFSLGLGLLTKAYFLAFLPCVLALVLHHVSSRPQLKGRAALLAGIVLLLSGPWYARNVHLYDSLTGMQESVNGVDTKAVLSAIPSISWPDTIGYIARGSLWTGNNHFATFSWVTLNVMLLMVLAGGLAFVAQAWRRGLNQGEGVVLGGILAYMLALVYATAQSYVYTKGASAGASVWYTQPLIVPVLCLTLSGLAYVGTFGRWIRVFMLIVWTYVMCASYGVKLIPLYGGYDRGKANVGPLLDWYRTVFQSQPDPLSNTALSSSAVVYSLTALTVLSALSICGILCCSEFRKRHI